MGKIQRIVGGVLILLALGLAAYAWTVSNRMADEQRQAQLQLQQQMQSVVVAIARIPAGTVMTPEMLRLASFPARPEGSYGEVKALIGRPTASDIAAGEPLLKERVEGNGRSVLQRLEEGERAVAIRVDDVIAVGNRLSPGDLVDAYVTLRRNGEEVPDTHSRLVLEKLRVLAFGNRDAGGSKEAGGNVRSAVDNPKTAVLAIKVPDVDKLALAAESGRLLLALRPSEQTPAADVVPADNHPPAAKGREATVEAAKAQPVSLTLRELVGAPKTTASHAPAAAAQAKAGGGSSIRVLHGLKETSVYLDTKQTEARP